MAVEKEPINVCAAYGEIVASTAIRLETFGPIQEFEGRGFTLSEALYDLADQLETACA